MKPESTNEFQTQLASEMSAFRFSLIRRICLQRDYRVEEHEIALLSISSLTIKDALIEAQEFDERNRRPLQRAWAWGRRIWQEERAEYEKTGIWKSKITD